MLSLQMLPMSASHVLLNALLLWHHGIVKGLLLLSAGSSAFWIVLCSCQCQSICNCAMMPMPARLLVDLCN